MNEGYRNDFLIAAWVSVLFLHLQVVKSEVTYLTASTGNITSRFYPLNYPKNHFQEWKIEVPEGYRIRLKFKDFNIGSCTHNDDILQVWNGENIKDLCGQRLPLTIESSENEMELFLYSYPNSQGGKFWANYETFKENELKTKHELNTYTPLTPTRFTTDLNTGDGDTETNGSGGSQATYVFMIMIGCVILLAIIIIYCGCKKRRRHLLPSPTPANTSNNADLENEIGILELVFTDSPPSYEEVTRQSIPNVSTITQQPSGDGTATENEMTDSSGLPSYREALRLSQQSLDTNL